MRFLGTELRRTPDTRSFLLLTAATASQQIYLRACVWRAPWRSATRYSNIYSASHLLSSLQQTEIFILHTAKATTFYKAKNRWRF